jgi:hypothetical protein
MHRVVWRLLIYASVLVISRSVVHAQDVSPKPADTAETKDQIELNLPLMEGDLAVTGRAKLKSKTVIVRVYSGWSRASKEEKLQALEQTTELKQQLRRRIEQARATDRRDVAQALECIGSDPVITSKPVTLDDTNGFEVTLKQRLNGGDCVVAEDASLDVPSGQHEGITSTIVRSAVLDLGRLRGYFTVGGSVSQGRSQFSQVDTFVGFTSDARILGNVVEKKICTESNEDYKKRLAQAKAANTKAAPQACQELDGPLVLSDRRIQLNAFTDARVGFKLASTGTGDNTGNGGDPQQPAFQRPDHLVFGADQPGYFQVGLHLPISFKTMDWRNDGRLYSFYFGPLFKAGVQSFDSAVVVSRDVEIDKTKPETDTSRFTVTKEDLRSGALPFYGLGMRVGIFRYELLGKELHQRQIANDPIGYFDVTFGKSYAYRSYHFTRTLNDDKTIETVSITSDRRPRMTMEGRLKLPYVPALIGIDINIRTATDQEPNEFRFLTAFRIDAQKALARIFHSDALTQ